jgi:g-D-glutamyl-meso-diaminopimelate peptidase
MANINGVDLGRQYPALWEKKYTVMNGPASELYNGESPATEPEVQTIMRVCKSRDFKSALAFYAKGETIEYADSYTEKKIPEAFRLARSLSAVTGYAINTVCDNPGVFAAGFECWFRQEFLRPSLHINLTPATGGAMPHHDRAFFSLVWDKTKALCAQALSAACQPKS